MPQQSQIQMTPGPRDSSIHRQMIANGRLNGTVPYRADTLHPGVYRESPEGPRLYSPGNSPPGPISVRVNGTLPGARLNISTLSKHSMNGGSGSTSPGNSGTTGTSAVTRTTQLDQSRDQSSHVTDLSHLSHISNLSPIVPGDLSKASHATVGGKSASGILPRWVSLSCTRNSRSINSSLTSLGLLCLISLILALLALTFLVEIDLDPKLKRDQFAPNYDGIVQEVILALAALTLALDLCCLLVCSAQFIFALKLATTLDGEQRLNKYLEQLSASRVCAIGAFFISIPMILTAVILYTFSYFQRTPAILTAICIGIGIVICGLAMVHIVFVWQKEKTKANAQRNIHMALSRRHTRGMSPHVGSPLPNAFLDLSGAPNAAELSTLV